MGASVRTFQVSNGKNLNSITNALAQNLSSQGYNCVPQPMGPQAAMLIVSKDNDGINNFLGLGVECKVNLTLNGNMLSATIESEWTNKIIAIAVGWFLCLVPFITGIIGAANQNSLPEKIFTAINMAINGGAPFGQPPFQQPPYQAPYQQAAPQYQRPPVQPPYQAPVQPPVQPPVAPVQTPVANASNLDETVRITYPSENQNN